MLAIDPVDLSKEAEFLNVRLIRNGVFGVSGHIMRAAWYERPGPAREVFVVGEMAVPNPKAGQVLVRIKASGINPSDYKRRANTLGTTSDCRIVPHSDGSGIVEAVGPGVPDSWLGRAVWIWNAVFRNGYGDPQPGESGTAAEYVAVPLANIAPLPDSVSFEAGACLGVPAFTAYAAVYANGHPQGKVVLVQGGAGAVGELAVQLAARAGATVLATVSSPAKAIRATSAGARHVINYRESDALSEINRHCPNGIDLIIEVDFAKNIEMDTKVVKPYGMIASYSSSSNPMPTIPYYPLQFKAVTVKTLQIFTLPDDIRSSAVAEINQSLSDGHLRPSIAACFALEDIALAHEFAESSPDGNVVLVE